VSWQITGTRRDAWAKSNPLLVEEDKAPHERGLFRHPEAHGHTVDRSVYREQYKQAEAPLKRQP
jgi:hypothetical protein